MIKTALIGVGKMGLSHLSILGAHTDIEIVGVADSSKFLTDVLNRYTNYNVYSDYKIMLNDCKPEAVIVAVPTKFHSSIVEELLLMGIHVFVEKPFCLNFSQAMRLTELAVKKKLANQVGYHNRFVGTFIEVKKIIDQGYLGNINHFLGEAYGPVVIKNKQNTWRAKPDEGGGCLMDYASHVIDLINYLINPINTIHGSVLGKIFSDNVEDSVYALLETENNIKGVLSVNWSDETYRKMSTSITINGTNGKIISDACELKVYFKSNDCPLGYTKGWNVKYITELSESVDFYLRGEEYSLQIDHFVKNIKGEIKSNKNTFYSASQTDKVIELIKS